MEQKSQKSHLAKTRHRNEHQTVSGENSNQYVSDTSNAEEKYF